MASTKNPLEVALLVLTDTIGAQTLTNEDNAEIGYDKNIDKIGPIINEPDKAKAKAIKVLVDKIKDLEARILILEGK